MEYEFDLRRKNDEAKIKAEMKAKAVVDRENQDLIREQIKLKAKEQRETVLESIKYGLFIVFKDSSFLYFFCSGT